MKIARLALVIALALCAVFALGFAPQDGKHDRDREKAPRPAAPGPILVAPGGGQPVHSLTLDGSDVVVQFAGPTEGEALRVVYEVAVTGGGTQEVVTYELVAPGATQAVFPNRHGCELKMISASAVTLLVGDDINQAPVVGGTPVGRPAPYVAATSVHAAGDKKFTVTFERATPSEQRVIYWKQGGKGSTKFVEVDKGKTTVDIEFETDDANLLRVVAASPELERVGRPIRVPR